MQQKSAKDLGAEASGEVETLSGEDALKRVGQAGVVFVDIREGEERQKKGKLKGAVHVPRGFLEFPADPTSQRTSLSWAATRNSGFTAAPGIARLLDQRR